MSTNLPTADPSRVVKEMEMSLPSEPEITMATRSTVASTPSTTLYWSGWNPITNTAQSKLNNNHQIVVIRSLNVDRPISIACMLSTIYCMFPTYHLHPQCSP